MGKKILVIDDDEAILESIQIILEEEEYEVVTHTSMLDNEAVVKISPNLIILDIFLSGSDGRDMAKQLKHDPQTAKIPIIMISALPSAQASAEASGADTFLPKPFDIYNLLELVRKYME
jgi:DNA-binding response OmpR family regulator